MAKIKLKKWQEAIEDWFGEYESYSGSETMQSFSQYDINKKSSLNVKMADGAGHTFLTSYLSINLPLKYKTSPVVVVYFDVDHLREIESRQEDIVEDFQCLPEKPVFMSVYELYYAINENMHSSDGLKIQRAKSKINGNIVVVDKASQLPNTVRDFILTVATNAVVFLG